MALTDNLVSYWKLDESSGNAADSVGSNTLTNVNSVSFVSAVINNGADFEASSSQCFTIADGSQSGLDLTGDMSFACWYKPETLPSGAYVMTPVVSKWVSTSNQRAYRFGISRDSGNIMSLGFNHSGDGATSTNNYVNYAFSTGTWYLIGMAYDASAGSVEFFVNSTSIGTVTGLATSTFNSSAQFEIGGNVQQGEYADGIVDEVRCWNRLITATDMAEMCLNEWTYTQDFDSLTTADLNGQDSWSADVQFDVQSSVVLQGTKSVACTPAGSNRDASRAITGVTDGGFSMIYRVSNATEGNGIVYISGAGGTACQIVWDSGTLKGYNGATLSNLASYSANTTYKLAFIFDCATDKYDVYLDDVKVADQFNFRNAQTSITSLNISSQAGAAGTIYFDDIKVYPPVTIFKDNFTGSTINTAIWNETDPDGVISQNNALNLDCEASTGRSLFYNKLQSVATITSGVACVQGNLTWTTDSTNEPQAGIFMYVDDNNYAAITTRSTPGGKYRCVINTGGGGFEYSVEPNVVKGKDVKITYDIASKDIKFYYWNGSAWVQMGTTQNANLGSTVYYVISGVIGTTPSEGVDPLTVDDAYFFTTDTSDHYPPDPPVTLNTTNFFF